MTDQGLTMGPYSAALEYHALGLSPIPLRPSSKRPSVSWAQYESSGVSYEQLKAWESQGRWGGVALLTGRASRMVAFDCDSHELREKLKSLTPKTWAVATGSGRGFHDYARLAEGQTVPTRHFETPWGHMDILSQGSIVVAPPSIHPVTGRPYAFVNKPATIANYTEFSGVIEFLQPYLKGSRKDLTVTLPPPPADLPPEKLIAAIGVVPVKPAFYFDVDLDENLGITDLLKFIQDHSLQDWDIYTTRGGCYVVAKDPGMSWDRVQELLDATKVGPLRSANYVRNCRELRIRMGPKFSKDRKVSPAPVLAVCGCPGGPSRHHDKRLESVIKEGYWTATE